MRQNLQWIRLFFTSFFIPLSIIIIFNYKIDSMGLFGGSEKLRYVADAISEGEMVAGLRNYNERIFQQLIIQRQTQLPECIVLGSSRSMQLRQSHLNNPQQGFFNHSVSGASLEDHLAILGLYLKIHDRLPPKILFNIDPWIFNSNNDQKRWESLFPYYYSMATYIGALEKKSSPQIPYHYQQLINLENTKANLIHLKKLINNKQTDYYITDVSMQQDSVKMSDGSFQYPYSVQKRSEADIVKRANEYAQKPVYSLENFHTLANIEIFEQLIIYLQQHGTEVVLILHPYNPIAYDKISNDENYRQIHAVEAYLHTIAQRYTLILKGSYNPHSLHLLPTDFFDGMHGYEKVTEKILARENNL